MGLKLALSSVAGILILVAPAVAQQTGAAPDRQSSTPAVEALAPTAQWRDRTLPLLANLIRLKSALGLSPAQVESIERLAADFAREAIRRQAEWQIALLDLAPMLEPDPMDPGKPIDLGKVEAKIRALSVMGADLELLRLRTIEAGKGQLKPEQRSKLGGLLDGDDPPDPPDVSRSVAPRGGGSPGHPGGGAPRPPGSGAALGHPPYHPGHPPGHFPGHGGVPGRGFVGVWPVWPWYWWGYPGQIYSAPPPAYWYYCPAYGRYYPDVPNCPEPWVLVPAG